MLIVKLILFLIINIFNNTINLIFFNKKMGFVYLITEENCDNKYKIGSTKKQKIEDRIKELQTGNPSKLILKDYFKTNHPFKLEGMLHRHYHKNNELNEWFNFNDNEIKEFQNICNKYQTIIDSLKDNPFF
jgi:hypothetical protein